MLQLIITGAAMVRAVDGKEVMKVENSGRCGARVCAVCGVKWVSVNIKVVLMPLNGSSVDLKLWGCY